MAMIQRANIRVSFNGGFAHLSCPRTADACLGLWQPLALTGNSSFVRIQVTVARIHEISPSDCLRLPDQASS